MQTEQNGMTFDQLEKQNKHVPPGDFLMFAKDFAIPVPKSDINDLIRKNFTRKENRPIDSMSF